MKDIGLSSAQIELTQSVFIRFPSLRRVLLFGSRAKGDFRPESDVDLALVGIDDRLQAEAIASELEELPLPYRFDVRAYSDIRSTPLREHIERVGFSLY